MTDSSRTILDWAIAVLLVGLVSLMVVCGRGCSQARGPVVDPPVKPPTNARLACCEDRINRVFVSSTYKSKVVETQYRCRVNGFEWTEPVWLVRTDRGMYLNWVKR